MQIIGFAKQIGDIADGASAVLEFCAIALLLTALAVYWYCHSVRFTLLPILCSLTSLVWQFGDLQAARLRARPLAVLVPFLVFAIGVSHGVAADQLHRARALARQVERRGRARQLHRPAHPRHAGAGHRLRPASR